MPRKRSGAWLVALCAVAGFGCAEDGKTQVLTGRVGTQGAIAVRAVVADSVVTAAQVRSDGSFTIALPAGRDYRLEVLTSSGVRHVLSRSGGALKSLSFDVCQPVDPFDVGGIGWGMDPGMGGGGSGGPGEPPKCNDPTDPNCMPLPECDPMTDPNCIPPVECDAGGTCQPPKCDPMTDPNCEPPQPCDPSTDPTDPNCGPWMCEPGDVNCEPPPPPCMDPTDPYCWCDANGQCPPPSCDPIAGTMCPPPPPPPCADPMDPETCKDPCVIDPGQCGCAIDDPNCWPMPEPPQCDANGMCDPNGMTPDHPPGDFGCAGVIPQ